MTTVLNLMLDIGIILGLLVSSMLLAYAAVEIIA